MWIVQLALRRRYTFVVMALFIAILGVMSIFTMPTDIFPIIDVPVVSVIWQFNGLTPKEVEGRIITVSERAATQTVNDIEHIESESLPGIGVIKVYFQPGANAQTGVAQLTSINNTILKIMPPGITPPLIIQYNASTVPVLQIGLGSQSMGEAQIYDIGMNYIRQHLVVVPGTTVPLPYGGAPRTIRVDLNIPALQAFGLSPTDVDNAVNAQNLILPAGTAKIGVREYNVKLNNQPAAVEEFNDLPIKIVNGAMVHMRDVANVYDGGAIQTNVVNKDGRPAALLTVLRNGRASTLAVVAGVKAALEQLRPTLPKELQMSTLFDQSIFVRASVQGVIREAAIAAFLTALMILLFLGSWKSTLAVIISIPLSILTSLTIMGFLGQSINIMTLGGLSLAVGILVDDATVEIENTNRNLAQGGKSLTRAILDSAHQIAGPAFVSTASICIVFIPVLFLTGAAKSLFTPLAMGVVFAMMASYLLSRTLVPVMVQVLLRKDMKRIIAEEKGQRESCADDPNEKKDEQKEANGKPIEHESRNRNEADHDDEAGQPEDQEDDNQPDKGDIVWRIHTKFHNLFERLRDHYCGALLTALDHRGATILLFAVFFIVSFCLFPFIGRDFFPTVDSGQISLHVQAPPGTRIEETGHLFHQVENEIHQVIPAGEIDTIVDNIGLPPGGVNLAFTGSATIGSLDGDILISLKPKHHSVNDYQDRLRKALANKFPQTTFFFQPADITTQILNFGLPAPIDIQVVGRDPGNYAIAQRIARQVRGIEGAADVHVHQVNSVPELDVAVDRQQAQMVGLTESDITSNVLLSLSGSGQAAPSYWLDPRSGISYSVSVQTPQRSVDSMDALVNTPIQPGNVSGAAAGATPVGIRPPEQLLGGLASVTRSASPQVVTHYNTEPTYDVYASVADRDLGSVAGDIDHALAGFRKHLPVGTRIVMQGQVQTMNTSFRGLTLGILGAIMLVYLLMVVNFQSWLDPLIIIMALPGALSGILWMLFLTQTTFSVPSLMGAIMCIGVATANSILLITFTNQRRDAGDDARKSVEAAGFVRLRPVMMTALALILGMLPMAIGLGEGGEQNAPLGRAVIGGVLVATFTTLFFVPVMYDWLRGKKGEQDTEQTEIDRFEGDQEEERRKRLDDARKDDKDDHDAAHNGRQPQPAGAPAQ